DDIQIRGVADLAAADRMAAAALLLEHRGRGWRLGRGCGGRLRLRGCCGRGAEGDEDECDPEQRPEEDRAITHACPSGIARSRRGPRAAALSRGHGWRIRTSASTCRCGDRSSMYMAADAARRL